MQKQTLIFVTILVFSFAGLFAGAYFLLGYQHDQRVNTRKPAVDLPLQPELTKPATENIQSSSGLQVQGANTVIPQKQQPQLPTSDQFEAYEQFSSSSSTQFQDILVGNGIEAAANDTVAVVYKGWLTDGTLFDQNRTNEMNQIETFNFTLGTGQVIPGWDQGIFGMKEGGKRRLIVPAALGYGETGQGPIPTNSMLIFDVEMIQVKKP